MGMLDASPSGGHSFKTFRLSSSEMKLDWDRSFQPYSAWWVTSRHAIQLRGSFALLVEIDMTISRNHHNNAQWCCLCKAPCVFISSRLIVESLHHTIPSTTTLSFTHSLRFSSQPQPFPTLANCLFTARFNKRFRCRSLLIRVALVCCSLHMFIQCRLTDSVLQPARFPPVHSASTYHTSL
jgi:hypothetical protein